MLASQMLWDPIRYDETCPSSDGACALVIVDEDTAAASPNPAWLHGTVMRSEATSAAERDQVNPQAGQDCATLIVIFSCLYQFHPELYRILETHPLFYGEKTGRNATG